MADPNDPMLKSWVDVPEGSGFPIQNLPFGIFSSAEHSPRAGVALGNHIIHLDRLHREGLFDDFSLPADVFRQDVLNDFLRGGRGTITKVRNRLSQLFAISNIDAMHKMTPQTEFLIPARKATLHLPVRVPNYTDFYSSEEHAHNVGSMFRDPKNALLPNWKHLPVGYHGRASSIVISGTDIRRPCGQIKLQGSDFPIFSPTQKLDFELEVAFVTCKENALGAPIPIDEAEEYIAGFVLFNDWSARDIQQWEYVPLGPFLGKNFASTISPWLVTLDALEPFRVTGPPQDPPVLPYLASHGKNNFDVSLQVSIQAGDNEQVVLSRSNMKFLYWNIFQQLAHHTVNGCNVQIGDLYASGTISGPSPGSFGSMLELSWNGARPLSMPNGSTRSFLQDGDIVLITGCAESNGIKIGFGECSGRILPARSNFG